MPRTMYPESEVELSDGSSVPLSVFGNPPDGLSLDELDEWIHDRDEELVMAKLPRGDD